MKAPSRDAAMRAELSMQLLVLIHRLGHGCGARGCVQGEVVNPVQGRCRCGFRDIATDLQMAQMTAAGFSVNRKDNGGD